MSDKQANTLSRSLSVIGKLFTGSRKGPSGQRVRQLRKLQKRIGVRFTDLSLLEQALTHRSYSHVTSQTRNDSNERMEFLGDSVLGLSVAQFLYLRFPDRTEGALSKMKSLLVSRKVLSAVARDTGFGEFLLLSGEESEMGGRDRTSILADSFEGVIGAIYLDQGYRAANKFIQRFLLGNIHEILKDEEHTNYKSLLQEYVQSKRLSHPIYRVRKEVGPEHEKEFAIEVVVRGDVWGKGRGRSKKDAEQNAARNALENQKGQEGSRPARGRRGRGERPEEAAAARPARGREGRSRSGRGRGESPRDEPKPVAKERGGHGVVASREKLRSQRQVEATEREKREQERRERRQRGRPQRAESSSPARERLAPAAEEATAGGENETRRRRGSRRGRRGGSRAPGGKTQLETVEPTASSNGPTPSLELAGGPAPPTVPEPPAADIVAPEAPAPEAKAPEARSPEVEAPEARPRQSRARESRARAPRAREAEAGETPEAPSRETRAPERPAREAPVAAEPAPDRSEARAEEPERTGKPPEARPEETGSFVRRKKRVARGGKKR
jgi:ribonuclease-3